MKVRFWGVRGSIPVPGAATQRWGGNSSCVEVRHGEHVLVLDCGTGARALGQELFQHPQASVFDAATDLAADVLLYGQGNSGTILSYFLIRLSEEIRRLEAERRNV